MRTITGLMLFLAALAVHAETAYLSERLTVPLRAGSVDTSPAVKNVESGARLEVLERNDRYARVRDTQGAEGWIEARLLTAGAPARAQLEGAQLELKSAQARVKQLEVALAARVAEPVPVKVSAPESVSAAAGDTDFPWGWLVLAFAMLWIGFSVGVVWLRERNRKKLGGMYLRI